MAYCAGEGVPIREEIVQTVGQSVITRNGHRPLSKHAECVLRRYRLYHTPAHAMVCSKHHAVCSSQLFHLATHK